MARRLIAALLAGATLLCGCGERAEPQTASPAPSPAPAATVSAVPDVVAPAQTPLPAAPKLQLPTDVTPLAYRLDLTVLPERDTFSGRARIDVRFDAATDGFWIHGRGLDVDRIVLRAGDAVIDATYAQVTPDGVARVTLARRIEPQTAQLDISYRGRFGNLLEGLFHVHVGADWYAFTQFEPIDARGVFPGFDEPRFKTPFTLGIVAPKDATVAANTPITGIDSLPDGTHRVEFEPTPPLPTYLVAFAVGPLDVVDGGRLRADPTSRPLRGLAARGRGDEFTYALANTPEIVALLEDYFAQPYPFAKLDLVAVPTQQGAMENPGLITYGEYALLFGERPPLSQQRAYANVHAHELAHQWFGNSVTMKWWDDLWLNEAFATFMSHKIVEAWRPSYRSAEGLIQAALSAMDADGLASVRRIREPIRSFNDITSAFDGITYQKGAGVLNMLDGFVGEAAFRDGVRLHLKRHRNGSADMSDLVGALSEASGRAELAGIMTTFTELSGTPLIDVAVRCGAQGASVTLSQRRYLPAGSKADPNQRWDVPVCLRVGVVDGTREQCVVLTQPTADVVLEGVDGCPRWVMPNRGGRGYYRWRLDEPRLDRLTSVMHSELDAGERLALADSLVAGVEAGQADLAAFFARVPELLKGVDRYLAMSPIPVWRTLQQNALNDADREVSRARMRSMYGPALAELERGGVQSDEQRLTRSALISVLALDAREPKLRAELTHDAIAFTGIGADGRLHRDSLDPNLVGTALRVAAQDAGPPFAVALAERLRDTPDPVLRAAFLTAIGSANDPALAQRLALDETIRGDDFLTLLIAMLRPETAERSWPWFAANVDALIDKSPTFTRSLLIDLTGNYCTAGRAAAVTALFEPRLTRIDGGRLALDQALERIGLCAALTTTYARQAHQLFH